MAMFLVYLFIAYLIFGLRLYTRAMTYIVFNVVLPVRAARDNNCYAEIVTLNCYKIILLALLLVHF